jgi:fermentation-respiration switch protein FrsA (DUF1100 family)
MMKSFILFLLLFSFCSLRSQTDTEHRYTGEFEYGNFSTDIIIEIESVSDSDQVFFSSPEQNAFRIPAQEITLKSDKLEFALQSDFFKYAFKGLIHGDSLDMNLNIDNNDYFFKLARSSDNDPDRIDSRDIRLRSEGLYLYGTVYFPENPNGKAIYLVTSSGNQDRSASRAEAEFLARQGYLAMHIDKQGTGISDGNWQKANIPELCSDDINAITYLAETNNLKYSNIGIKGSSQGASKVPYILSKMPELGFGIAVSCPASTLLESDLNYWKNRTRAELSEEELNQAAEIQRSVFLFIAGEISQEVLSNRLDGVRDEPWMKHVWVPELGSVETDRKLMYTPIPYFEELKKPILVIQGSSDEIIPDHSLKTIQLLTEKDNMKNEYIEIDSADHSMMFKGDSDFPYWPSLHPEYRSTMISWLNRL